jgi:hypothetical protein
MERKLYAASVAALLLASFLTGLRPAVAEELMEQDPRPAASMPAQRRPGFPHILGSIVFTTLFFPAKLLQCVGTQAVAAVAYTATFGVEGNYDGGTNGKEIGNIARHACTGSWIVRPSQVVRDYGE